MRNPGAQITALRATNDELVPKLARVEHCCRATPSCFAVSGAASSSPDHRRCDRRDRRAGAPAACRQRPRSDQV